MYIQTRDKKYRMNSIYSPEHEASVWSDNCFDKEIFCRVITVYGLGNGYFVRELLKRLDDKGRIIIYEPFISVFEFVIEKYDISDILMDERVYLYVGEKAFNHLYEIYVSSVTFDSVYLSYEIELPFYKELNNDVYRDYCYRVIGYKTDTLSSLATMCLFGKNFVQNSIYALRNIKGCSHISKMKKI